MGAATEHRLEWKRVASLRVPKLSEGDRARQTLPSSPSGEITTHCIMTDMLTISLYLLINLGNITILFIHTTYRIRLGTAHHSNNTTTRSRYRQEVLQLSLTHEIMASETLWSSMVQTDGTARGGVAVSFFLGGDLADKGLRFVARQSKGMSLQVRQSHGWLAGTLDAGTALHRVYIYIYIYIYLPTHTYVYAHTPCSA
jgi:hypothetical protein